VKELQQVAVVAGDLDDLMLPAEAESLDHLLDVPPGVLHPALRYG
jgi:hypothetical protein